MDELKAARTALEKIKDKAHGLALFNPVEETSRAAWDIFWLATAGLEGQPKASALACFTKLSGVPTDDIERQL